MHFHWKWCQNGSFCSRGAKCSQEQFQGWFRGRFARWNASSKWTIFWLVDSVVVCFFFDYLKVPQMCIAVILWPKIGRKNHVHFVWKLISLNYWVYGDSLHFGTILTFQNDMKMQSKWYFLTKSLTVFFLYHFPVILGARGIFFRVILSHFRCPEIGLKKKHLPALQGSPPLPPSQGTLKRAT